MINNVLQIFCVYKHTLHPDLIERAKELINLCEDFVDMDNTFSKVYTTILEDVPLTPPKNSGKFWNIARARNKALDTYLEHDVTHVFMVDADLIEWEPHLPCKFLDLNPEGITAPMVWLEDTQQFYDTLGFIECGGRVKHVNPVFRAKADDNNLIDLDSVGCIYLTPVEPLQVQTYASYLYDPTKDHFTIAKTGHTDHWPIMQAALKLGRRVACCIDEHALHAYLPSYNEEFH